MPESNPHVVLSLIERLRAADSALGKWDCVHSLVCFCVEGIKCNYCEFIEAIEKYQKLVREE